MSRDYELTPQGNNPTLEELESYKRKAKVYRQLRSIALILFIAPISIIFLSFSIEIIKIGLIFGFIVIFLAVPVLLIVVPLLNIIGSWLSLKQKAIYANIVITIGIFLLLLPWLISYWYWYWEIQMITATPITLGALTWVIGLWLMAWPNRTIGEQYRAYSRDVMPRTDSQASTLQNEQKNPVSRPPTPLFLREQTRKGGTAVQHPKQKFSTISNKEFDEFYHDVLAPQLNELEPLRKQSNISGRITSILFFPLVLAWVGAPAAGLGHELERWPAIANNEVLGIFLIMAWIGSFIASFWLDKKFSQLGRQRQKDYQTLLIVLGISYILLSIILYWQIGRATVSPMIAVIGAAMILFVLRQRSKEYLTFYKEYRALYKSQIVPQVLQLLSEDLTYTARPDFSRQFVTESKLFKKPHQINVRDSISGSIDGITYNIAEMLALRDKGQSRGSYIVFNGLFCTATFPKRFNSRLHIRPENQVMGNGSRLGNTLVAYGFEIFESSDRIHTDDREFELCFRTYGSQPQEARRLLSPKLVSNLLDLHRTAGRVSMTISGNTVYLAIWDSKNYLEPPAKQSTSTYAAAQNLVIELEKFISIIDYLNVPQH